MDINTKQEGSVRIVVHGFRTQYTRQPAVYRDKPAVVDENGVVIKEAERHLITAEKTIATDWVDYSPAGSEMLTRLGRRVDDLLDVPESDNPQDIAYLTALARKRIIQPLYEAWKGGNEVPAHGTPLGAWPGVTPAQVDMIRLAGIHTVEDLASCSENQLLKIRLPNNRDLRDMAKRFLAASQADSDSRVMGKLEQENALLKDEMAELRAMLMAMNTKQAGPAPAAASTSDDEELEALRELAREAGIQRVGNKSKETLERELEALQTSKAA